MRHARFVALVFGLALLCGSGSALAASILYPPDRIIVRSSPILVIGAATTTDREVPWDVGTGTPEARSGRATVVGTNFEIAVPLSPGLNRIRVANQEREVFFETGKASPPAGFSLERRHAGDFSKCQVCHSLDLTLRAEGYPGLCLGCHKLQGTWPGGRYALDHDLHFKANIQRCGRCHETHGSSREAMLRGSCRDLCGGCHPERYGADGVHPAYDEGGCAACHDPHYTPLPNHLLDTLPGTCHRCHSEGKVPAGVKVHPPAAGERACMACHDPHGAGNALLRVSTRELCTSCHPKVLKQGHWSEFETQECTSCHDPHGRLGTGLVRDDLPARCGKCHESVTTREMGKGTAKLGCATCHDPHVDQSAVRALSQCTACHKDRKDKPMAESHGGLSPGGETCVPCHPPHVGRGGDQGNRIHASVAQGKCSACHEPTETGEPTDRPVSRCRACHPVAAKGGGRPHPPVADGQCTKCHQPHVSVSGTLLRSGEANVCGACHKQAKASGLKRLHTGAKTCSACHEPHGGPEEDYLLASGPGLCTKCHQAPPRGAKTHAPVLEGCTPCHDPHSGLPPASLRKPPRELCLGCHQDHSSPERIGQRCTDCHEPHSSERDHLLRQRRRIRATQR